jgi:hypothetical protein
MTAIATSNYIGATSALAPFSLAGNPEATRLSLFVMIAAIRVGLMIAGRKARLWAIRHTDHTSDPVSIYRILILLAECLVASRGGVEAEAYGLGVR